MNKPLRYLLITSLLITITTQSAYAPPLQLRVSQQNTPWSVTIGQIDLTGAGGSDFGETESAANEKEMDIRNPVGNWRIDVKKTDSTWNANIHLYIKRTGNGTGAGPFSGGLVYQELTDIDAELFSGTGASNNVPLQFKLGGSYASNGVSTGVYTTTITYTITDNL